MGLTTVAAVWEMVMFVFNFFLSGFCETLDKRHSVFVLVFTLVQN